MYGFSLVELMIVVGIISILISTARPLLETFIIKARQTEALTNLRLIDSLLKIYLNDKENVASPCGLTNAGGNCQLSNDNISTSTSCNEPNQIGFSIPCQSARYKYHTFAGFGLSFFQIWAIEIYVSPTDRRVGLPCPGLPRTIDVYSSDVPGTGTPTHWFHAEQPCP